MITSTTIQANLDRRPFVPFIVVTNDGQKVRIDEPNLASTSVLELLLYAPADEAPNIPHHLRMIIAVSNIMTVQIEQQAA